MGKTTESKKVMFSSGIVENNRPELRVSISARQDKKIIHLAKQTFNGVIAGGMEQADLGDQVFIVLQNDKDIDTIIQALQDAKTLEPNTEVLIGL